MVNLRAAVNSVTQAVNPNTPAQVWRSAGETVRPSGERIPAYDKQNIILQVQALSAGELRQLDGLNITGTRRAIYANGAVAGIIRPAQKGGDLIVFKKGVMPEGTRWLCVHVLEQWKQWVKFAIVLQDRG